MGPRTKRLRDIAAKPTLQRIRRDSKRVSEDLKPVLKTIEENLFNDELNVNYLWQKSKVARWRSGLFTKQLGATPAEYIARKRLKIGAELLKATSLKGWQVAQALGYGDVYDTFSKAFKIRYGVAPSKYRAQFRDQEAAGIWGLEWAAETASPAMSSSSDPTSETGKLTGNGTSRPASIESSLFETALHFHAKGARAAAEGDVDVAFEDLVFADQCYARAGELSPHSLRKKRRIPISHMTDEALLAALCPACRTSLVSSVGSTVRAHLRQALRFVPRDLRWFEECCETCYRTVWDALRRARLGLMDDAWKAWWLSTHVDPMDRETPPSVGRVIAALVEVERLVSGDQLERKAFAEIAVDDAVALGEPLLEAQARLWLGAVLGAMSQYDEARRQIADTGDICQNSPWLSAMCQRVSGLIEYYQSHYSKAIHWFEASSEAYVKLDPHLCGLLLVQQANVYFDEAKFEKTIALNISALESLDNRREPLPGAGVVPIHLANAYCRLGQFEKAALELEQCHFDRDSHHGLAATEASSLGCLKLLQHQFQTSLNLFNDAMTRFQILHRPLDAALNATYAVEAHAWIGDRCAAATAATAALNFFEAAGCSQDALITLGKIQALLAENVLDAETVAVIARHLTRQHGGWLPEPRSR